MQKELSADWRCLLQINDHNVKILNQMVIACCKSHNICEIRWEDLEAHLLVNVTDNRESDG